MADYGWDSPFTKPHEGTSAEPSGSIEERFPGIFNRERGSGAGGENATAPREGGAQPGVELTVAGSRRAGAPASEYTPATGRLTDEQLANQGWGQYLGETAQNIPGSAKHVVGNIISSLSDPGALIEGVGQLGTGAISKAKGYLGVEQDPAQKAQAEAGLDALVQSYKDQYGDWNKIRRTVHDNPVAPALDIASVAPGIGMAGKVLGMGEKAGAVARGLGMLDPVQAGLTAAKTVIGKPAEAVEKKALQFTSGVPTTSMDVLQKIGRGKYATPAEAAAARQAYTTGADAEHIAASYEQAAKEAQQAASDEYMRTHRNLATTPVPTAPIVNKIDDIINTQLGGHTLASGLTDPIYSELMSMRNRLTNSVAMTPNELNILKKDFDLVIQGMRGRTKYLGAIGEVPRSIIGAIGQVDPTYAGMLRSWGDFMDHVNNLNQTFGKAGKASDATILKKMAAAAKTPHGQNLLAELQKTPSGKYLPEQLAGYFTKEWSPGWGTSIKDILAATLLYGSGVGLTPAGLGTAAAASPKVVGAAMRGLGKAKGMADTAGAVFNPTTRGIMSHFNEAGLPVAEPLEGTQQAAGGRIGRKSGGRVGNPGAEAERLMVAAEKAKKRQSGATSALLDVPDEAIAKALAVANEHI